MFRDARTPYFILMLLLWVGTACGTGLGGSLGMEEPTAEYQGLEVTSLDTSEIGLDLGFDLGNPNSFALPLITIDWNLDLFDDAFSFGSLMFEEATAGAPTQSATGGVLTYLGVQHIPAGGAIALNAPFTVALTSAVDDILRVASGADIPYLIGGTLRFESTFVNFDLPFEHDGVWLNADIVAVAEDIGGSIIDDIIN